MNVTAPTLAAQALPIVSALTDDDNIIAPLADAGITVLYAGFFGPLSVMALADQSFLTCPVNGPADWRAWPDITAVQQYLTLLHSPISPVPN
jgi:hypothetical protein